MSKTVPVYGGASRPCSPACAVLGASWCLAASRIALAVHGVSTTPATTPQPPSAPAGRDADPARQGLRLDTSSAMQDSPSQVPDLRRCAKDARVLHEPPRIGKSVHMAAPHHLSGPWPMSMRPAALPTLRSSPAGCKCRAQRAYRSFLVRSICLQARPGRPAIAGKVGQRFFLVRPAAAASRSAQTSPRQRVCARIRHDQASRADVTDSPRGPRPTYRLSIPAAALAGRLFRLKSQMLPRQSGVRSAPAAVRQPRCAVTGRR
jgi:hypothetical protein